MRLIETIVVTVIGKGEGQTADKGRDEAKGKGRCSDKSNAKGISEVDQMSARNLFGLCKLPCRTAMSCTIYSYEGVEPYPEKGVIKFF